MQFKALSNCLQMQLVYAFTTLKSETVPKSEKPKWSSPPW